MNRRDEPGNDDRRRVQRVETATKLKWEWTEKQIHKDAGRKGLFYMCVFFVFFYIEKRMKKNLSKNLALFLVFILLLSHLSLLNLLLFSTPMLDEFSLNHASERSDIPTSSPASHSQAHRPHHPRQQSPGRRHPSSGPTDRVPPLEPSLPRTLEKTKSPF